MTTKTKTAKTTKVKTAKAKAAKAKAAKPKAAKAARQVSAKANGGKPLGQRAQILADAQSGKLPSPPDFSADTHTRFRPKLAEVVAMAKARDLKGLKTWKYEGFVSSSPKAIQRYRDLCIVALEAIPTRKAK